MNRSTIVGAPGSSGHSSPIAQYLAAHTASIARHYDWSFDSDRAQQVLGVPLKQQGTFARTLELKEALQTATLRDGSIDTKLVLASYFVKEWGGIRGLSAKTLRAFVIDLDPLAGRSRPSRRSFAFKGVSSWSKWLSILCPQWAAIYDARVAYSLNAINYLTGAGMKVFPMPEGRNRTMRLLDAATLALSVRLRGAGAHTAGSIKRSEFVSQNDAYETYLDVLTQAHQELWPAGTPLGYTEMLLFALADTEIFNDLVRAVSASAS